MSYKKLILSIVIALAVGSPAFADTSYYLFPNSSYEYINATSSATTTTPTWDTSIATTSLKNWASSTEICSALGKRLPTHSEAQAEYFRIGRLTWYSQYNTTGGFGTTEQFWLSDMHNSTTTTKFKGLQNSTSTASYITFASADAVGSSAKTICVSDNPVVVLASTSLATSSSVVLLSDIGSTSAEIDMDSTNYLLGVLIFLGAMVFLGLIFNSVNPKR